MSGNKSGNNGEEKPTPTVEEINAYLEKSAARTRKRLPLAMSKPEEAEAPKTRALPLATANDPTKPNTAPTTNDSAKTIPVKK